MPYSPQMLKLFSMEVLLSERDWRYNAYRHARTGLLSGDPTADRTALEAELDGLAAELKPFDVELKRRNYHNEWRDMFDDPSCLVESAKTQKLAG